MTVKSQKSPTYILAWTTDGLDNSTDAITSSGTMTFEETDQGISATDWSLHATPGLVPAALRFRHELRELGGRHTVFPDLGPAEAAASGAALPGLDVDEHRRRRERRVEHLVLPWRAQNHLVPAFLAPVEAAGVQTQITQALRPGRSVRSGTRTVCGVYGVGPVMITFQHAGGGKAPGCDDVDPAEHEPQAAATAWRYRLGPVHEGSEARTAGRIRNTCAHPRSKHSPWTRS